MKIVHFITGLGVGGAENVVYNLSKGQIAAGHQVEVILVRARTEMLPLFVEAGIPVHILGIRKSIWSLARGVSKTLKLIKILRPDLIHAHMAHACLLATAIRWYLPDLKLVFTSHNIIIGNKLITALVKFTQKWRDADIIFSVSQQGDFNNSDKICVIPNGVIIEKSAAMREQHKSGEPFRFVAVGRLELVKNHMLLIEIAAQLKDQYLFTIDIFGDGYLREELSDRIRELDLQQIVTLKGLSMNISSELVHYHAFVMPSLWEGMPITILEAGAAGLPIIATSVGSIPDFLNGSNSYVCALDDFKEQMIALMVDFDQATEKARHFREYILRECDIDRAVEQHLLLYRAEIQK